MVQEQRHYGDDSSNDANDPSTRFRSSCKQRGGRSVCRVSLDVDAIDSWSPLWSPNTGRAPRHAPCTYTITGQRPTTRYTPDIVVCKSRYIMVYHFVVIREFLWRFGARGLVFVSIATPQGVTGYHKHHFSSNSMFIGWSDQGHVWRLMNGTAEVIIYTW